MAADRPYPPLRGLTMCRVDSGCLESGRVQGGAIPRPLTDWEGEVFAGAAPYQKPNAQYRVAFLSPDISPVRVQGGQRLVARRGGRNSPG